MSIAENREPGSRYSHRTDNAGDFYNYKMQILLIIGIILLVLWLLGLITSTTLGGFVYVALVVGLILVVVWLVMRYGRRR
jgi:Flp pilus assembly protein TadB